MARVHIPSPKKPLEEEKSPEVEEMEVVTAQLSRQLYIEDIDAGDTGNPQLCSEYVKEIYEYMMMLEVRVTPVFQVLWSMSYMMIKIFDTENNGQTSPCTLLF